MSALDLQVVGMGLVSPTGLRPEDHAFFVRAGSTLNGPQVFESETGEPIELAHCPWLGAEMPLRERTIALAIQAAQHAIAPWAAQQEQSGQSLAAVLTCPAPCGLFSEGDASAIEAELTARLGLRFAARATGAAGFFTALQSAAHWLASGAEQAVLLVAVDSFVSPVLLAERGHVWSRWLRNSPPLAEAAAAVVVSTPAAAQDLGLDSLGRIVFSGADREPACDDNDIPVDGSAMTRLLRNAATIDGTVTQSFGPHNIDRLRQQSFDYAVSRNPGSVASECRLVCVEDDIGCTGAASGGVHLVYGLAVELHRTAPFGAGGPLAAWSISRDGTRGLCIAKGAWGD